MFPEHSARDGGGVEKVGGGGETMAVGREWGMGEQSYCKESKGRQRGGELDGSFLPTSSLVNLIDPSLPLLSLSPLSSLP